MEPTINIPLPLYNRMLTALEKLEKYIEDRSGDWVSKEVALRLLGCKGTKLYELKEQSQLVYKKVGRSHQFSRKSIEAYIKKMSSN